MRIKPGDLRPIDQAILEIGIDLQRHGQAAFHGYEMAKLLQRREGAGLVERLLPTARGTLYRALARLQEQGFVATRWEEAEVARDQSRPPRCYYEVTAKGSTALARAPKPIRSAAALQPSGEPA